MAIYNDLVVTEKGLELLRDLLFNPTANAQRKLKAKDYGMKTSDEIIKDPFTLESIKDVKQELGYSVYPDPFSNNQFILEGVLNNAQGVLSQAGKLTTDSEVKSPYTLNTIVFYAGNGLTDRYSNVLFAVITAKEAPDLIPAWDTYPVNLKFKVVIAYQKGEEVKINASYDGEITKDQVHAIVKAHNDDYAAHGELLNFYDLMNMRNTRYSYIKSSENKITETIKTIGIPTRTIAENISEKKDDGWQVTEKLYSYNEEKIAVIRTRTTTYKKVGNEWEATVV